MSPSRRMRVFAWCVALVPALLDAQAARRAPAMAGNQLLNVLVELDGTVKVWGPAGMWELTRGFGAADPGTQEVPTALPGVSGIVDVAVGPSQVLLLTRDSTVLAWGGNDRCEVGTGTTRTIKSPVLVQGLTRVVAISAGEFTSAAIRADGTVWLWGNVEASNLGLDRPLADDRCVGHPVQVAGIDHVVQVEFGATDPVMLKDDGSVWTVGKKPSSIFGARPAGGVGPIRLPNVAPVAALGVGDPSVLVLADGHVLIEGPAPKSVRDRDPKANVLRPVPNLATVRRVKTHNGTFMAQLADGTLRGWGNGYHGSLGSGHGDRANEPPTEPIRLGPVLSYMQSGGEGYAIRPDGTLMRWGVLAPESSATEFELKPVPWRKVTVAP